MICCGGVLHCETGCGCYEEEGPHRRHPGNRGDPPGGGPSEGHHAACRDRDRGQARRRVPSPLLPLEHRSGPGPGHGDCGFVNAACETLFRCSRIFRVAMRPPAADGENERWRMGSTRKASPGGSAANANDVVWWQRTRTRWHWERATALRGRKRRAPKYRMCWSSARVPERMVRCCEHSSFVCLRVPTCVSLSTHDS